MPLALRSKGEGAGKAVVGLEGGREREGLWKEASVVCIVLRDCLELSYGTGSLLTPGSACIGGERSRMESEDRKLII